VSRDSVESGFDGVSTLLGGGENLVRRHRPATGQQLCALKAPGGLSSLVFSPDGRRIACIMGGGGAVRAYDYDADTGE
jgi:hypothetical protein